MMQASLDNQADMSIQHAMLVEAIGGAETVKSCAAEGQMLGQWRRMVDTSARTQEVMRRPGAAAINLATLGQQFSGLAPVEIGRAPGCTPVTTAQHVCRLLLAKKKKPQ